MAGHHLGYRSMHHIQNAVVGQLLSSLIKNRSTSWESYIPGCEAMILFREFGLSKIVITRRMHVNTSKLTRPFLNVFVKASRAQIE